ncbi:hypothetical protein HID58_034011, partial [Brassica napus]
KSEAKSLWDKCLLKISPKCALDIIEGKICHDALIKYIVEKPRLVAQKTNYLKKSDDLWTHYVSISQTA